MQAQKQSHCNSELAQPAPVRIPQSADEIQLVRERASEVEQSTRDGGG